MYTQVYIFLPLFLVAIHALMDHTITEFTQSRFGTSKAFSSLDPLIAIATYTYVPKLTTLVYTAHAYQ